MGSKILQKRQNLDIKYPINISSRLINITKRNIIPSGHGLSYYGHNSHFSHCPIILRDWPYEPDNYDDHFTEYLVVRDPSVSTQLGSLRLLRTDRPHVLGSIFPDLCKNEVPRGFSIREINQIHLSPKILGKRRRIVANQLASALVQYGLLMGIESFTMVIEAIWSDFVQTMGWDCEPLGPIQKIGEIQLGAFRIDVDSRAVKALRASNCYVECDMWIMEPNVGYIPLQ
nr:acyl-homoserine-lactone synthase [Sphingobium sp. Sx8-8]